MKFEINEDTIRCVFTGTLDSTVCGEISSALNEQLSGFVNSRSPARIVFDLMNVRYICSTFLRLCLFHCKRVGVEHFRIENPSKDVNRVFQIAGFSDVITIV